MTKVYWVRVCAGCRKFCRGLVFRRSSPAASHHPRHRLRKRRLPPFRDATQGGWRRRLHVTLHPSQGTIENLQLLADRASGVSVAFAGGVERYYDGDKRRFVVSAASSTSRLDILPQEVKFKASRT